MKLYRLISLMFCICLIFCSCEVSEQGALQKIETKPVNNLMLTAVESDGEPKHTYFCIQLLYDCCRCMYYDEAPAESVPTNTDIPKEEFGREFAVVKVPRELDCVLFGKDGTLCYKSGIIFGDMPWYGYFIEDGDGEGPEMVCIYIDKSDEYNYIPGDREDVRLEMCYPESSEYTVSFSAFGPWYVTVGINMVTFGCTEAGQWMAKEYIDEFYLKEFHGNHGINVVSSIDYTRPMYGGYIPQDVVES